MAHENIEKLAKQIAEFEPHKQAELFQRVAQLVGQRSSKELAESYQLQLKASESIGDKTKAQTPTKTYPTIADTTASKADRVSDDVVEYGRAEKTSEKVNTVQEFYVTLDGEVLKPEGEIELDRDRRYRVLVEKPKLKFPPIKNRALRRIAARAFHTGIHDFAEQHDHYLYGVPKK